MTLICMQDRLLSSIAFKTFLSENCYNTLKILVLYHFLALILTYLSASITVPFQLLKSRRFGYIIIYQSIATKFCIQI